jgi:peptide-methionine (R)-S-oxide reductase
MLITRRVLLTGSAVGVAAATSGSAWWTGASPATAEVFEVTHTDAEWHKLLTTDQYAVLRQSATERPFTSALLHEKRRGNFACVGCDLGVFSSTTKYDSGTGGPSFWAPLEGAVGTTRDTSFGTVRTAVHCDRCGGHHHFGEGEYDESERVIQHSPKLARPEWRPIRLQ